MRPRPSRAMKLIASGLTFSAAMMKSPSFSRSSSSTTMRMRPARMASSASSMGVNTIGLITFMSPSSRFHKMLYVSSNQVVLYIDAGARDEIRERRGPPRVGHDRELDPLPRDPEHRQADAVHRDRAARRRELAAARQSHGNVPVFPLSFHRLHGSHAVHVALQEVASEPVSYDQRALEVDAPPRSPGADRGVGHRLPHGLHRERLRTRLDDRQADTVDRDRLPDCERSRPRRGQGEPPSLAK